MFFEINFQKETWQMLNQIIIWWKPFPPLNFRHMFLNIAKTFGAHYEKTICPYFRRRKCWTDSLSLWLTSQSLLGHYTWNQDSCHSYHCVILSCPLSHSITIVCLKWCDPLICVFTLSDCTPSLFIEFPDFVLSFRGALKVNKESFFVEHISNQGPRTV